ncbi:putative beta-amyrin 11-oxidase [Medicago truncatula]|uniref:Putative beta-amyrin 11-oxidase n=1 Tax=Medicago truncatula TaxID=3880 RepID=A0A396JIM9_MEDTR|nr:putative beta-amyrin 11-oxidase [Medicago truncatula]
MDPTYYPNSDEFNPSRWNVSCITNLSISCRLDRVNPDCPITSLPSPKPKDNCLAKVIKVSSA